MGNRHRMGSVEKRNNGMDIKSVPPILLTNRVPEYILSGYKKIQFRVCLILRAVGY
jgi:hypothetical protein